jgi:hypothetical protein
MSSEANGDDGMTRPFNMGGGVTGEIFLDAPTLGELQTRGIDPRQHLEQAITTVRQSRSPLDERVPADPAGPSRQMEFDDRNGRHLRVIARWSTRYQKWKMQVLNKDGERASGCSFSVHGPVDDDLLFLLMRVAQDLVTDGLDQLARPVGP